MAYTEIPVSWWTRCRDCKYKKQQTIPALPHIGMTAALTIEEGYGAEPFKIKDIMWDEATGFFWIELEDADEAFEERLQKDCEWEFM